MAVTFRTQARHWIAPLLLAVPISLFSALAPLVALDRPWRYAGLFIGALVLGLTIRAELVPMARTRITVGEECLSGRVRAGAFRLHWERIRVARLYHGPQQRPYLLLGLTGKEIHIPLHYLPAQRIWRQVQAHVDPLALEEAAYAEWLDDDGAYQEWRDQSAVLVETEILPLRTRRSRWIRVVGGVTLLFFLACAAGALYDRAGWPAGEFLLFALLGVILLLPETLEMDSRAITHTALPFGRHRILWEEVERIEQSPAGDALVFYGRGKRLAIVGLGYWEGRHMLSLGVFLQAQIEQRGIEVQVKRWAAFKVSSKNTRVR